MIDFGHNYSVLMFVIFCSLFLGDSSSFSTYEETAVNDQTNYKNWEEIPGDLMTEVLRFRNESLSRKKRQTFAFPLGSRVVNDYYITLPIPSPIGSLYLLTLQVRFFTLFPNISLPQGRSLEDRATIYGTVESVLEHFGINGRACMLRAVCERHEHDVVVDGIVGEALSLLLDFGDPSGTTNHGDYTAARDHGRAEGNCQRKYKNCPFSLFQFEEHVT